VIEYEIEQSRLHTPVNLNVIDKILSWDVVENASNYLVWINEGDMEYTVNVASLSLVFLTAGGVYEIKVKAIGCDEYLDSDWSEVYMYEIEVSEDDMVGVVLVTGLIGNYPNPFNPMTVIQFSIGNVGNVKNVENVKIEVFNLRGQKVRTLVNEEFQAGEYSVVWDGRDENGRFVSSGVYFSVMRTGGDQSVIRMVLMK